jgi:hypothetical protein
MTVDLNDTPQQHFGQQCFGSFFDRLIEKDLLYIPVEKVPTSCNGKQSIAKESFLAVATDAEFCDKWMTLDTWAELIYQYCNLINSYTFSGNILNKVFRSRCSLYLRMERWCNISDNKLCCKKLLCCGNVHSLSQLCGLLLL